MGPATTWGLLWGAGCFATHWWHELQVAPSLPASGQCWSCPSCLTACPGQGDILPAFLDVGLPGFLEEGWQDKPSVRHTREGGGNLAGVRGWEGLEPQGSLGRTGLPAFLAGPSIPKHFLFLSPSASCLLCQGHGTLGFSEH